MYNGRRSIGRPRGIQRVHKDSIGSFSDRSEMENEENVEANNDDDIDQIEDDDIEMDVAEIELDNNTNDSGRKKSQKNDLSVFMNYCKSSPDCFLRCRVLKKSNLPTAVTSLRTTVLIIQHRSEVSHVPPFSHAQLPNSFAHASESSSDQIFYIISWPSQGRLRWL